MKLHPKSQPKVTSVQVRLVERDPDTAFTKNKSFTLYDTSLEEVYELFQKAIKDTQSPKT